MAQQQAFDTEIAARRLNGEIASTEADAVANAAADGAGLHDTVYGQTDPHTGRVLQTGRFDTLFDTFVKQAPPEVRAGLASRKGALREAGSVRMVMQQLQRRKDYEQAEVDRTLTTSSIAIGKADPDDLVTFEAARQQGLDLIDKMGVDPGIRQQMAKDWFSTAAKARFEALIAKDPQRALDMFGAGTSAAGSGATGDTSQAPGSSLSDNPRMAGGKEDRVGTQTPDDRIAQAFRDDIPPEDRPALVLRARTADAVQQVETRANISMAEHNAPAAIRDTGTYSGPTPTAEQFIALYGTTEGVRRFKDFNQAINVSRQFYGMRGISNDAVRAMIGDASPKEDSANPDKDRADHHAIATAADLTFRARQGDPGGYVRKTFARLNAAWNNLSKPEDYQAAIVGRSGAVGLRGRQAAAKLRRRGRRR